jgi:hypothetical protein
MYDPSRASQADVQRVRSLMQGSGSNAFESAVLDAGYRGYVNREQGTAVVLGANVPVAYEGVAEVGRMRDRTPQRIQTGPVTRTEGGELVRRPTGDEMTGIIRARPALAEAAPSFRLEFGEARVAQAEAAAADQALADSGAAFQFGDVPAFSERQRDVTPMGFYSELARQIDKGPGQAPKDQWKAYIKGLQGKGVKADEPEGDKPEGEELA